MTVQIDSGLHIIPFLHPFWRHEGHGLYQIPHARVQQRQPLYYNLKPNQ
jgi:hypothetical protein